MGGMLWLLMICGSANAEPSAAPSASLATDTAPSPSRYYARFAYLTSRAGSHDFRSFRSSGSDESGSMSESSSLPNMNYISAVGIVRPSPSNQLMFGGLQGLDSTAARTIKASSGRSFVLPGQIAVARYKHDLGERFNVSVGDVYIDNYKFLDPTAGIAYRNAGRAGWIQRAGLDFSAPLTERSKAETLITRGTLRTRLTHKNEDWIASGGLAYSRPFYSDPAKAGTFGRSAPSPSTSASPSAPRRPSGGSAPAILNNVPTAQNLEAVDLVMIEPESARTTASVGAAYLPSPKWRISSNAGATYLETARGHTIWMTSAKVLAASYRLSAAEVGSDFTLYSDARKFAHPSLPSLWALGLHISYSFGTEPTI